MTISIRSRRHAAALPVARTLPLILLLVSTLMLCVLVQATPAAASPTASSAAFRCLRPFGSMDSFGAVAKADATQNCNFGYFDIVAASAELQCATTAAAATAAASALAEESSCNVTVRWSMRRARDVAALLQRQVGRDRDYFTQHTESSDGTQTAKAKSAATAKAAAVAASQRGRRPHRTQLPFVMEEEDVWRYSLSLKAKGDSTVNYKGFANGDGYSMCCDAIEESACAWMAAQQGDNDLAADEEVSTDFALQRSRVLRACPLPFPAPQRNTAAEDYDGDMDGDDDGGVFGAVPRARVRLTELDDDGDENGGGDGVFHGVVTKPLHRMVEGQWEAMVQLWRRRQRAPATSTDGTPADAEAAEEGVEAEMLGRVVVPFSLNLAELAKAGRVRHVASMALVAEGAAEVSTPGSAADADDSDL